MTFSNVDAINVDSIVEGAMGSACARSQDSRSFVGRTTTTFATSHRHQADDHIAIQGARLLEELNRALDKDLHAAKASAARLSEFLARKFHFDVASPPSRGGLAPWQRRKLQNYIEDGLEGPLQVTDLARLAALSPSYLTHAFKQTFGTSPHAYILEKRIDRARTLMLTTSKGLCQIALTCGFSDQAHFSHCFRRIMGISPNAWRRHRIAEG